MKKYYQTGIILCITIIFIFAGCKKDTIQTNAALNIINASPDVPSIAVNFTLTPIPFYRQNAIVGYGSSGEYGQASGNVPLTLVSSADTTHHIFQQSLNLKGGGIYSLYVYGNLPNIETMLLTDNIPVHKDSTCGVRFVNLSPDAGTVSIDVQGGTAVEFSNVAYKSITAFKNYPFTSAVMNNAGGYNFEIKDAGGNVITTVFWSPQLFQNNTMVISGSKEANTLQVAQINNY